MKDDELFEDLVLDDEGMHELEEIENALNSQDSCIQPKKETHQEIKKDIEILVAKPASEISMQTSPKAKPKRVIIESDEESPSNTGQSEMKTKASPKKTKVEKLEDDQSEKPKKFK